MFSFWGFDNVFYYCLINGQLCYYVNDMGIGNMFNVFYLQVLCLVMDSLWYWVEIMGVDGFWFDLVIIFGWEDYGFDLCGSFFDVLWQDLVLVGVKMIVEFWDIGFGGYWFGEFMLEFVEWNDMVWDIIC